MKTRGFTLVEVLVVMTIVVLLMGILVPALSGSRERVRSSVCASNIRQVHLGNTTYAHDHAGHYVLAAEGLTLGMGGTKRWHGQRVASGVSANPQDNLFDPDQGPLRDYLGINGRVKECPSLQKPARDGALNAFEAGSGGYGYNHNYIGGRNDLFGFPTDADPRASLHSARVDEVHTAEKTLMFTDAAIQQKAGKYLIEYSFAEPPYIQSDPGPPSQSRTIPSIHFRHKGSCNVVWVDGHVNSRSLVFTRHATGNLYERLGFGWFGPDSNELFDLE